MLARRFKEMWSRGALPHLHTNTQHRQQCYRTATEQSVHILNYRCQNETVTEYALLTELSDNSSIETFVDRWLFKILSICLNSEKPAASNVAHCGADSLRKYFFLQLSANPWHQILWTHVVRSHIGRQKSFQESSVKILKYLYFNTKSIFKPRKIQWI